MLAGVSTSMLTCPARRLLKDEQTQQQMPLAVQHNSANMYRNLALVIWGGCLWSILRELLYLGGMVDTFGKGCCDQLSISAEL